MFELLKQSVDVQGVAEIETYDSMHLLVLVPMAMWVGLIVVVIRQIRNDTDLSRSERNLWTALVLLVPWSWVVWLILQSSRRKPR